MGGVKDKTTILFKPNTTKDCSKVTRASRMYGVGKKPRKPKTKKEQLKDNLIKNGRNLFQLKKENAANKYLLVG